MVDAEKVKAGLEHCDKYECIGCPYRGIEPTDYGEMLCFEVVSHDALEAIAQLEERIAIMQESMETLEKQVADSWPTPHAQWLVYKSGNANCSACGYEIFSGRERTPYCPRCGCVMEEVSE